MFSHIVVGDVTPREELKSCTRNNNSLSTLRSKLKSQPSVRKTADCFLSINRLLTLALKDLDTAFSS
jgi:hypothetical protein